MAGDVLEIAQQRELAAPLTHSLLLLPTLSLFLSHSTVLLCPHILLGDDANASNCILGLVIYCRSMRIIFTRLPTRSASVCVYVCCIYVCYVCAHLCRHQQQQQQLPHYAAWKEITSISRENLQIFYLLPKWKCESLEATNVSKMFSISFIFSNLKSQHG